MRRYTKRRAWLLICASVVAISGSMLLCLLFFRYTTVIQTKRTTTPIRAIVQTSLDYTPLQTTFLAEIMDLSVDRPTPSDLNHLKKRLLATHVIKEAELKRLKPAILFIDYRLRTPLAYLGDYTNTMIASDGTFFPHTPYLSPKNLPQIYLGSHAPANPWGETLLPEHLTLINALLTHFSPQTVERIDLAHIDELSAGRREIVLLLRNGTLLRLTPKNYPQELTHYFMVKKQLDPGAYLIDLRVPEIAYMRKR